MLEGNMNKRILVADDNVFLLKTIQYALESAENEVTTAMDGKEALSLVLDSEASGNKFHLLITDLQMPNMTGLELIDELKKAEIELPILVLSGCFPEGVRSELTKRGCFNHLEKPVTFDELLSRVAMISSGTTKVNVNSECLTS